MSPHLHPSARRQSAARKEGIPTEGTGGRHTKTRKKEQRKRRQTKTQARKQKDKTRKHASRQRRNQNKQANKERKGQTPTTQKQRAPGPSNGNQTKNYSVRGNAGRLREGTKGKARGPRDLSAMSTERRPRPEAQGLEAPPTNAPQQRSRVSSRGHHATANAKKPKGKNGVGKSREQVDQVPEQDAELYARQGSRCRRRAPHIPAIRTNCNRSEPLAPSTAACHSARGASDGLSPPSRRAAFTVRRTA